MLKKRHVHNSGIGSNNSHQNGALNFADFFNETDGAKVKDRVDLKIMTGSRFIPIGSLIFYSPYQPVKVQILSLSLIYWAMQSLCSQTDKV